MLGILHAYILLVMNGHYWCVTASSVLIAKSSEAATMLLLQAAVAVGCCCCCQLLLRSLAVAGCRLLLQAVAGCRLLRSLAAAGCRLLLQAVAVAGCRLLRAGCCRLQVAAAGCVSNGLQPSFCSCRLLYACFLTWVFCPFLFLSYSKLILLKKQLKE